MMTRMTHSGFEDETPGARAQLRDGLESPPIHDANTLTEGGGLAHIAHEGKLYVLRITRAGKLILTK